MLRLAASLVFFAVSMPLAADAKVELLRRENAVEVIIGGQEFTTLHFDKSQKKPFFSPVRAADGAIVTRPLENPVDHPHHKGIWCAIDEVNGIKFWAEQGTIENHSVELVPAIGNPAKLRLVNHWLGKDGKPLLIERSEYAIFDNRMIAADFQFTAGEQPVTFEDTKEGLFGIRVADSLREQSGGRIVNAEGLHGMAECWGKESKWVDYVGDVGGRIYGVTLIDHPQNFRKSRFHVRNYGLFTLSPFGQAAYTNGKMPADPLTLDPGKSIRLRYGLAVHTGETADANVPAMYDFYLNHAGE